MESTPSEKEKAKWQGNIENRKEVRARNSLLTGEGNMENTPSEKEKAKWQGNIENRKEVRARKSLLRASARNALI